MSALRSFRHGRLRRVRSVAIFSVLILAGLMWISAAQAVHDNGMFELDGNTVHNGVTTPPYDWNSLFGAAGNRLITPDPVAGPLLADTFVSDAALPDQSYFTSNKDIQPIASGQQHWGCDPINNALDKDDLLNAYAALVQVPANAPDNAGHQVLYLASERGSNNGTSFAGFWLLKDKTVGCSGSNDFSGQHTDGDLLVVSDYTNGGGTQDVSVYRWTGNDASGTPVLQTSFNGSICSLSLVGDNACAIANAGTITTPWSPTSHDSNTFVEAGIDLTALLGANGGCFTDFLAETRSSAELTATLKDFAGGQFNTCVAPNIGTTATPGGSVNPTGVSNQHDIATVTKIGNRPDPTGSVSFFLCNPSQVTAGGCGSGGTQVGGAVPVVAGSATSANASGSLTTAAGKYCWRAEYTPDAAGSNFYVAGSHTNGTTECFSTQASPGISTTQNPDHGVIGGTYKDTAHLTGGSSPTGTITFKLFSNDDCTGLLDTETASVSGNGDYATPTGFALNHAGTYYWVASYGGDSLNNAAGPTGCTDEPVAVAKNSPGISTTQNPDHGAIGALYKDTAHLTGGAAPTGTITFRLYSNDDCTGLLHSETATVSGNGDYPTATGFVLNHAGTYYWTASYGGDLDNNAAAESGCAVEPVVVAKNSPGISTTQDPDHGAIGALYKDTAHLTGGAAPTGTITFNLYSNDDCTGLLHSETASVTGNGDYPTATGFVLDHAGTYYWTASYGGDSDNNAAAESGCAVEPVAVGKSSPGISTTQNPDHGAIGATYKDTAHLTGGAAPTGTITFNLYSNDDCTGLLHSETASVNGNGDYPTATGFVLNHAGTYYWTASYGGDSDNNAAAESGCAVEPVAVAKNSPAISTTQDPDHGAIGALYKDTAHLTGGAAPSGTITFKLYSNDDCTGLLHSETASVNGNGDYPTATGFVLNHAGTYYWTASYGGDSDNNAAAESGCAVEPVVVAKNSPAISTTQNPAAGNVGDLYKDTASLTGGAAPTGTITFRLYSNDDCTGLLETETVPVNGNGDYSTPAGFVLNASGVYYWVASYGGDSDNLSAPSGCADEPVAVNAADIHIVKTADDAQVNAGEPIGFTLTVYNDGNGDAKGVTLTDTLPVKAGLSWSIDAQGLGWASSCDITAGVLSCGPATVPAGTTLLNSTFTVHITSPTTAATGGVCPAGSGVITNTGDVTTTNDGSDESSDTTCVAAPAIHIVKTADAAQVNAGEPIGFTLTVYNSGSGDAHGVNLTDTLPVKAGLSWSIADQGTGWNGTCKIDAGVLSCGPVTVPPGTTQGNSTFTVHITSPTTAATGGVCPAGSGVITNTGDVSTTNDGSDESSDSTCVAAPAIHIVKTADAAQVNAGEPIGFTLTVYNSGSGDAHGVNLTDTLPVKAGLNWSIADQGTGWNGTCKIDAGVLSCGPVTVPAGTTQGNSTFTVHITSPTTAATGGVCPEGSGVITNTGDVSTTNDGSDESSDSTCVAAPEIHIVKTADAAQVNAGEPIGFTLTVYNTGTGDAHGVTLADTLPVKPGLSWSIDAQGLGWASSCDITAGVLSCGPVTVPAGTTQAASAFTVHITSPTTAASGGGCPEGGGVITNTGDVSTTNDGSDESSASTCVAAPEIHILKTADAAQVNVGSPIGFTMTVWNDGSGDAHGVTLSDTLPTNAGLSWSIASQGAGWNGSCAIAAGVLSCGPVTVPSGTTQADSTYTVHITSSTTGATGGDCPNTGVVDNTGTVTTSNDGSDESSASTCVQALVDLSVTKAGSPATQTLGDGNITWSIVVTNNGPSDATGVTIADPMPAGNTFVSATSSKGSCTGGAILNCNIGTMAAGESVTITLITTPSTVGDQTNTVNVAGSRPETNTGNNSATATVQTVAPFTPPPVFCVAVSRVTPKQLFVGRKTNLTIRLTQHGKAVKGVRVRIKGPKIDVRTAASNSKGVIRKTVKMKKAGILIFSPLASKRCNTKRLGVTNVFTPPVTG